MSQFLKKSLRVTLIAGMTMLALFGGCGPKSKAPDTSLNRPDDSSKAGAPNSGEAPRTSDAPEGDETSAAKPDTSSARVSTSTPPAATPGVGLPTPSGSSASSPGATQLTGSKPANPPITSNPCQATVQKLQQEVLQKVGVDTMLSQMKRIVGELTSSDREDLAHFAIEANSTSTASARQEHLARMIRAIYERAGKRTGLGRGATELRRDLSRTISPTPTGTSPLSDGMTILVTSAPQASRVAPLVGDVTDAFLVINAEQDRHEVIFFQAKTVKPAPRNGFRVEGEYVTMSEYVASKLPGSCANAKVATR